MILRRGAGWLELAGWWLDGSWIDCSVNVARPVCHGDAMASWSIDLAICSKYDTSRRSQLMTPVMVAGGWSCDPVSLHEVFRSFGFFSQTTSWDMPVRLSWPLIDTLEYARKVSLIIPVPLGAAARPLCHSNRQYVGM